MTRLVMDYEGKDMVSVTHTVIITFYEKGYDDVDG